MGALAFGLAGTSVLRAQGKNRAALLRGRCSQGPPAGARWECKAGRKVALWTGWATYVGIAFFSDWVPGDSVFNPGPALRTAFDMSVNFWFIMPTLFPKIAPVVNPTLEGLFNFTVIYGSCLMLGFLSDGGSRQKPKAAPFTVAVAFLTNESKYLPIAMVASAAICLLWSAFGRPGGEFGGLAQRWEALVTIVNEDRLAVTFVIDCALYALLQGALVADDMARRGFNDKVAQVVAAVVPYFGLAYYFWVRPPLREPEETL